MGLLILIIAIFIIQNTLLKELVKEYKDRIYNLNVKITKLEKLLENSERSEKDLYD
jgi:hypothetical protein